MTWPPALDELKRDMKLSDNRDDDSLQQQLDAAVAFVERVRPVWNYGDELSDLPDVPDDFRLGVLRLAGRWFTRRRSPDALVAMGEMGAGRVPSFDPDIDRMLGIGRYQPMGFA
jgi:hypothetical protein